jgi:cellulose biosynthesis protein BcsQ
VPKRGLPNTLRMRHDEHYVEALAASAGAPVGQMVAIDLLETIEKVRQRPNPALRILGVVITMHDKRTALGRDIREQIQKVFGGKVFKTVISKSVRLEESPAYKESIFTFAPESTGATDYYSLCEEVIERVEARSA